MIDRIRGRGRERWRVTGRQGDRATTVRPTASSSPPASAPTSRSLRELRLGLDPAVEATPALAPLIDPNVHSLRHRAARTATTSCAHPEPGFYIVGMKSYGRAPTFLLATGYEQVRSVAAALAGDWAAAREVQLDLPETGVCSTDRPAAAATAGSLLHAADAAGRLLRAEAGARRRGALLRPRGYRRRADRHDERLLRLRRRS